jgi:acyl carrier protein
MTRDEMLRTLAAWIGEITERDAPALTEATHLVGDLGLDSLALAELGSRVRVRYRVQLRPTEVAGALQAGALVDLVMSKVAHEPAPANAVNREGAP